MTQATPYTRQTGFADDERNNAGGRSTVLTADVDAELDSVGVSLNRTIANLALLQRDDGIMRDGIVPPAALGADTLKLLTTGTAVVRGAWTTGVAYLPKDLVTQTGNTYICAVAHTAGVFATDLAAVKWVLFQLGTNPSAAAIPFSPTANVTSTNLQAALVEVDTNSRTRDTAGGTALSAAITATLANFASTANGNGVDLVGGAARYVANVAALRLLLKMGVGRAVSLGYYAPVDGGGGQYYCDTSDTSSGALFTASTATNVLTVTAVANGTLSVGQVVARSDTGAPIAYITSLGTGSGGTGTYNLNTAVGTIAAMTMMSDNGGTVIVAADGGRWKLFYTAALGVSVKQFGAKGDGITDDAAAFTAALAWARDATKLITVPNVASYYNVATTVSFPGHTANAVNATSINYGVRLLGIGGGGLSSRPKIQGNINGFLFNLGGSSLSNVTYSDTLEGLYLGNFSSSASSGCVKLGYVWDCTLKDCRFGSAGVNVDMGAWTMSSRFDNVRQDGTGSTLGTATTVAYGAVGGYFTGAWAVTMSGGSIFNCQYGFRGYGDITQSGHMDIEHVNVIFNFIAEGPYVFDAHIEDFDCLFTNDSSVYPTSFATAGGSAGTGDCMFTFKGSFSTWRGTSPPIVVRPLTAGRQFINLDDTFNKGGPYTAHNMSGAWNAVTDMTNTGQTPCVVSLKRTSPLPDFATTGWKPNYGTARTAKYALIEADRAETSGQFRLGGFANRLATEQVLKANITPNGAVNVGITNGTSFAQGITATGARPGDFVRIAFLNNAGTGGLPNGVVCSGTVTANDTVTVNFINNSGASATVFGTTYAFVDPHDSSTVD